MPTKNELTYDVNAQTLICSGDWDLKHLPELEQTFAEISLPHEANVSIDGKGITKLDSAGAWLLATSRTALAKAGNEVGLKDFSERHITLINIVAKKIKDEELPAPIQTSHWLHSVGHYTTQQLKEFNQYLSFIGQLTLESIRILKNPSHLRFKYLAAAIYENGYQALPIIALLSFMIGVVITYQMGIQLRTYGADIYIVDLLGLSILREFAPLLTAIIIAGRTGSAFTAQLGIMKINEEVDAITTMGITPAEILVIPRVVALVIVLPLLTIWSDIFGVIGGMVMANNMLNITWYEFLQRFAHVIPLKTLIIGLGKTPIFALLIATIGCFEGMQVENNANSLGRNTTRSVVWAIFFIIIADAVFSIIFSKLNL